MKRREQQVKEGSKATPIKTIAEKREEAQARQELRDKRGHDGQINMLDSLFGKGKGAVRERKRLGKLIHNQK
ncbi:hypothetical protein N9955_00440 [bacterium]|nr:hypothetical protein [bacterium]